MCNAMIIFYSQNLMHARKVLAIPDLGMLKGDNPRALLCQEDPWTNEPTGVMRNCFDKHKQFEPKGGYSNVNASLSSIESAKKVLRKALKDSFDILQKPGGQESGFQGEEAGELTNPNYWAGIYTPCGQERREGYELAPNEEKPPAMYLKTQAAFIDGALSNEWQ